MPVSENAGRANRPDLKELVSHLDDLKELMEEKVASLAQVADERDRRYEERFKAMDEKTSLALTASEKAVSKAEMATEKRFDSVNEFRGSLKDQAATLMPREEADAKFKALESKIDEMKKEIVGLREFRSEGGGKAHAHQAALDQKQFDIRTLLSVAAIFMSIVSTMLAVLLFAWRR
jgi:chromosome segregation ATPase